MKKTTLFIGATAVIIGCATVAAMDQVADDEIGLSRTSVFDIPSPAPAQYQEIDTDDAKNLPRAFHGAPPQIPHEFTLFLPITAKDNECLECHDKPKFIGKNVKGESPMPKDHYTGRWIDAGKVRTKVGGKMVVNGAQYYCMQCHVPQAEVKPLVANTFAE